MKNILEKMLSSIAAAIVKKYHPIIIAITGSAGKTSAREAVFAAISENYDVRASIKNYNNELGLPLSVIGARASGKNVFGWFAALIKGWSYLVFPRHFPKVLLLEMAADRPGDLAKLVKLAPPDISVVTSVGSAHIEFFGSESAIAEEKGTIVRALKPDGVALLNADDPRVVGMRAVTKARVVTFGIASVADVRATKIEYIRDPRSLVATGLSVEADVYGEKTHFNLVSAVGKNHVLAALAGLAVARILAVKPEPAARGLEKTALAPGRSRLIPGIKETTIIDDSYNASPAAVFEALRTMRDYPFAGNGRRIVVLGDMLELGGHTEPAHREVGIMAAMLNMDYFYGVGERMLFACEEARRNGMAEDRVIHMENAGSASRFLQERLRQGDVILIKGSQGMRMERAVRELMLEPERAEELLCRQGSGWEAS
jgi:UDP-N-acetylmuramoyl-tripeptide--D-alanyl-D-alanine ligase